MKFLDKMKGLMTKKVGKIVGFAILGAGNVAAVTVTTIAWFNVATQSSNIEMVSGDLGVEIEKVTAYKYVYPYYKNSTEFIDYDSTGTIKKYVLEDHSIDDGGVSSDDATITLGASSVGTNTTTPENASALNVCIPNVSYVPEFRYYLIGDSTFYGVDDSWTIGGSYAFALRENVTNNKKAVLDNIVVSAGSNFTLIDILDNGNGYSYQYFPFSSISANSPFEIIDSDEDGTGDSLHCLRSGIYTFTYGPNQLKIETRESESGQRKDISVIMNNSLDPTKISIDYSGSESANYNTINAYMPTAIYNQNTAVILDVELNYKNPNTVEASLEVNRTDATSISIFNTPNKYADTTHNRTGYVDSQHVNPLRASDFYNFYAKFKKTPYASASALWTDMHRQGDNQSQKFVNGQTYDKTIACTLHVEGNDSTTIGASAVDNIYHCYVNIDYDYEHCVYFLDKNRLGKTYLLDRDFGFHFYGTQITES